MLTQYVFYTISALTIFSALKVVLSRNPVYSVLYLVVTFVCISIHYFLLNAPFLAAVHIIVYAGALMLLFLYVLMMLNLNREVESNKPTLAKIAAGVSGILLAFLFIVALSDVNKLPAPQKVDTNIGMIENLGKVLYTDYMLPFEVSAVLFLAGMVGAVMLGKKETT